MGSPNHIIALQQFFSSPGIDPCKEQVLEVGSKNYGNTADFKTALGISEENYIGVDMEAGNNVDIVLDFTLPFEWIDKALGGKRFTFIICCSVLEHCSQPFKMAENIQKLLAPGGYIFIAAPFVWRVHAYPDDLFRYTPSGLKTLFQECEFLGEKMATGKLGEIDNLSPNHHFFRIETDDLPRAIRHKRSFGIKVSILLLKFCKMIGEKIPLQRYPHLYPPVETILIGIKKETPTIRKQQGELK